MPVLLGEKRKTAERMLYYTLHKTYKIKNPRESKVSGKKT